MNSSPGKVLASLRTHLFGSPNGEASAGKSLVNSRDPDLSRREEAMYQCLQHPIFEASPRLVETNILQFQKSTADKEQINSQE